jgi:recombination protein RecA
MASLSVRHQPATEPAAFAFPEKAAALARHLATVPRLAQITPASQLEMRPEPEMVSIGVREMDALAGGLPRGCLTEIFGPASSGRTSVLLAALAAATRRQEACALVDVTDAFDPRSGAAAGLDFARLLWVRCHAARSFAKRKSHGIKSSRSLRSVPGMEIPRFARNGRVKEGHWDEKAEEMKVEQALRVVDLLLQSGGFGMVAIDLGDVPEKTARRVPLASWFRFQRAVEGTPTILLVISRTPCAQSCATLLVKLKQSAAGSQLSEKTQPSHARILEGLRVEGELLRSRMERKPAGKVCKANTAVRHWG